jgi:general stress protein 26
LEHHVPTDSSKDVTTIAAAVRALDFCLFTTMTVGGGMRARPMSHNGAVEFDGDVWFFSSANSRKVFEIQKNYVVHLGFAEPESMKFVSMGGVASIVTDEAKKEELWTDELDRWFPAGPTDQNVVLIKVTPNDVGIWDGEDESQITLSA